MEKSLTQKQQHWQTIIEDWSNSGLSQTDYCRRHDINIQQFYSYKSSLSTRDQSSKVGRFLAVVTEAPSPSIQLRCNGVELEYQQDTDETLLKQLLLLLREEA